MHEVLGVLVGLAGASLNEVTSDSEWSSGKCEEWNLQLVCEDLHCVDNIRNVTRF